MSKKALSVSLSNLDKYFNANPKTVKHPHMRTVKLSGPDDIFFTIPSFLADRSTCETDPSIVQLLPYITIGVIDESLNINVSVYKRASKGGEQRLRDSSIGYGGHVEEEVTAEKNLLQVLTDCAVREVEEETGIKLEDWQIKESLSYATIFHETSEESGGVGKYHLAITFNAMLKKIPTIVEEEGCIEDTRFMNINTVVEQHRSGQIKLEPWSRVVAGILDHVK
jgi:predicted NUDIX family phosphoesterase